jgi:hypothetical protein
MTRLILSFFLLFSIAMNLLLAQGKILIPMDLRQSDHLKAYGIAYAALTRGMQVDWLLNYRSGSFLIDMNDEMAALCRIRGVFFNQISGTEAASIYTEVQDENNNMDVVRLEKDPKIAVYIPPEFNPWDDAVTLALDYAEIPYDKIWNDEILRGDLSKYDWLHLHHEDFTGQYGKFYASFANTQWYIEQQITYENNAKKNGFRKVSEMMRNISFIIKSYVANGGFLFAMCSATDSYDIALSAKNVDICDKMFDGDSPDQNAQSKLDYSQTLAFTDFKLEMNPYIYEYSDIDIQPAEVGNFENDYFTLFDFSAKYDPVPTMLTQNHVNVIRGFMGQTTAFRENLIKKSVTVMGKRDGTNQIKYIRGDFGRGTFCFLGGHDPEDYQHQVGDPPTELSLHKNSPGYRLILNNVLFPAAKKKKLKT